jgi:dihydrolipoamide dehydrogenase
MEEREDRHGRVTPGAPAFATGAGAPAGAGGRGRSAVGGTRSAVVVGGGPGGYTAALGLARAGWSVRLVEAEAVGGTCLHRGCVPTKALLAAARAARDARRAAGLGVRIAGAVDVDWEQVRAHQAAVVARLERGLEGLLAAAGVEVVRGRGRLAAPEGGRPRVEVVAPDGTLGRLVADAVVLAPGSRPALPPVPGLAEGGVLVSDGLLAAAAPPRRLLVVGGGAVGCEFASAYADLGCGVTLVEAEGHLLPAAEPELGRRLEAGLRRRGVEVRIGWRLLGVEPGPVACFATPQGEVRVAAEAVLVAVGRRPATDDLGLEAAGVRVHPGGAIAVDARGATTAAGVWAVGDAVGGPMLAHAAFQAAERVVAAVVGRPVPEAAPVPHPVFAWPEVAWVGATEAEARGRGLPVRVSRVPFAALARAQAEGEDGLCKVVADGDGRLLGVHLVGPQATELVGTAALALAQGARVQDVVGSLLPHPTLSEALWEAAALLAGAPRHVAG